MSHFIKIYTVSAIFVSGTYRVKKKQFSVAVLIATEKSMGSMCQVQSDCMGPCPII